MTKKMLVVPHRCRVCAHPDRHAIEMAHVAGCSLDAIVAKFSTPARALSRSCLHRHVTKHLDETLRASLIADVPLAELVARAAKEGLGLLDYFHLIRSTLIQQMLVASGTNDGHRTAVLAGRAVETLKEIGRLTGELSAIGNKINIVTNNVAILGDPRFLELQTGLIALARSHPDARADIVALLRGFDEHPKSTVARPNGAHGPMMIEGEARHVG
jgi:hypothetical protein